MRHLSVCAASAVLVLTVGLAVPAEASEFLLKMGDVQVPAGTVLQGTAIAVGGTLDIEGDVDGDAVAIGGNVRVAGYVAGSARAVGGNVTLLSTAVVDGAASAPGGHVDIAPGAIVGGAAPRPVPRPSRPWFSPSFPWSHPSPHVWWWWPPAVLGAIAAFQVLYWFFALAFLVGFIGTTWLTAILFPGAVSSLAGVLERAPAAAFALGLLGWALLTVVTVVLAISLVGLPLVFLIPLVVFVIVQFGITAIALLVGRRVRRSGIGIETVIGAVILAVGFAIPHLGWLVTFAISTFGLGVVLLTLVERRRGGPLSPPGPPASVQGT